MTMKIFKICTLCIIATSVFSCNSNAYDEFSDYEKTPSGLYYKFHKQSAREKLQSGDAIYGQYWQYWCDSLFFQSDTMVEIGKIDLSLFSGDIIEGFLMMRVEDSASFILNADSVVKHWGIKKDPYFHLCDCLKMTVHVKGIGVPQDELGKMMMAHKDSVQKAKVDSGSSAELNNLKRYIAQKKISVQPNDDGVYVIVQKKGTGAKITEDRIVAFDYIGRLLNNVIWDSSIEEVAGDAGVAFPQRAYEPKKSYRVIPRGIAR